uniref:Uncharacterized protein n=1 Tax=Anguilla anguilla TaxID=7936 RepID=A0A0E9RQB1_ANGAN
MPLVKWCIPHANPNAFDRIGTSGFKYFLKIQQCSNSK